MVLADSAYNSIAFLKTVKKLKIHAVVGIKSDQRDGRSKDFLKLLNIVLA